VKNNNNFIKIGTLLRNNKFRRNQSSSPQNKNDFNFLDLLKNWQKIVGVNMAEHTSPLKFINKKLTIITNHSVYSHQLKFLEKPIIDKIYNLYPALNGKINSIVFLNDSKNFHEKKLIQSKKVKKQSTHKFNKFNPEYIKLNSIAAKKFENIKDQTMRDLLISIYIQSNLKHA